MYILQCQGGRNVKNLGGEWGQVDFPERINTLGVSYPNWHISTCLGLYLLTTYLRVTAEKDQIGNVPSLVRSHGHQDDTFVKPSQYTVGEILILFTRSIGLIFRKIKFQDNYHIFYLTKKGEGKIQRKKTSCNSNKKLGANTMNPKNYKMTKQTKVKFFLVFSKFFKFP